MTVRLFYWGGIFAGTANFGNGESPRIHANERESVTLG
jgi:hypothetical protein